MERDPGVLLIGKRGCFVCATRCLSKGRSWRHYNATRHARYDYDMVVKQYRRFSSKDPGSESRWRWYVPEARSARTTPVHRAHFGME
jgi:hypothetical protein